MTKGRIGRSILGCSLAVGVIAATAGSALATSSLNGALIERLTSTGFVATSTPQPNVGAYDTSSPYYPQGWIASGIAAITATDAWAVGSYVDRKGSGHAATEHFDGSWHNISNAAAPAGSSLSGVVALASNNVWAVGTRPATVNGVRVGRTLIEHWDGTKWSLVASPDAVAGTESDGLSAIAASSAGEIWAIGAVVSSNGLNQSFFEHFTGSGWTVAYPNGGTISRNAVIPSTEPSVSVDSPTDAWAATGGGTASSLLHWNGQHWAAVYGVFPNGYEINAVYAASSSDVWAIGDSLQASDKPVLFEHWNGSTWQSVVGAKPGYRTVALVAAAGSGSNDIYAVGAVNTQSYPSTHTLVEHWNGTAWSIVHSQNPSTVDPGVNGTLMDYFNAVSAVSGAAFVSGAQGGDQGG